MWAVLAAAAAQSALPASCCTFYRGVLGAVEEAARLVGHIQSSRIRKVLERENEQYLIQLFAGEHGF